MSLLQQLFFCGPFWTKYSRTLALPALANPGNADEA